MIEHSANPCAYGKRQGPAFSLMKQYCGDLGSSSEAVGKEKPMW